MTLGDGGGGIRDGAGVPSAEEAGIATGSLFVGVNIVGGGAIMGGGRKERGGGGGGTEDAQTFSPFFLRGTFSHGGERAEYRVKRGGRSIEGKRKSGEEQKERGGGEKKEEKKRGDKENKGERERWPD